MKRDRNYYIQNLQKIERQIADLKEVQAYGAEHTQWEMTARKFFSEAFGSASEYTRSFEAIPWKHTGVMTFRGYQIEGQAMSYHRKAYIKCLEHARGLLNTAIADLQEDTSQPLPIELLKNIKSVPNNINTKEDVLGTDSPSHKPFERVFICFAHTLGIYGILWGLLEGAAHFGTPWSTLLKTWQDGNFYYILIIFSLIIGIITSSLQELNKAKP